MKSFTDEFGKDCHVTLEEVNEDRHIYVEYNGRRVSRSCTKFSFEAEEEDYKICVNPQYFSDPQCAVKLEYTSSSGGQLQVWFHRVQSMGIFSWICLLSGFVIYPFPDFHYVPHYMLELAR